MVKIENIFYNIENKKLLNIIEKAYESIQIYENQIQEEFQHDSRERQESVLGIDITITEVHPNRKLQEADSLGYFLYRILSYAKSGVKFITSSDAMTIVDSINRVSEIIHDFTYDRTILTDFMNQPISIITDCQKTTPEIDQLLLLLGEYCNMVSASHSISGHGKLWEPSIQIKYLGNEKYKVSFCSYQAGDVKEPSISGDIHHVNKLVRERVNKVKNKLMKGTSNSNPLVMIMQEEDYDSTIGQFMNNQELYPNPYSDIFLYDEIFLPRYTPFEVEYSGYPYDEYNSKFSTVSVGNGYYPQACEAIGYDKIV